jgi:[ribosomal protein S18]-alanine N-acetyltransferase
MKNAFQEIHCSATPRSAYASSSVALILCGSESGAYEIAFWARKHEPQLAPIPILYSFPVRYRLYQPGDFPSLYAVEELCFQPPFRFSRSTMRQLIGSANSATWIAEGGVEAKTELIGFSIVEWPAGQSEAAAYIQTLEVLPAFRGRGVGAELLVRAEESARSAGAHIIALHVDIENTAAIRLYQSRGYVRQGREEHYYARHRAAFVYAKRFSDSIAAGSAPGR